jgi:hypothetical protein
MRQALAIATIASVLTFGVPEKSAARFFDPVDLESAAVEAEDGLGLWDLIGIVGVCALLRRHLEHHDRDSNLGRRTARHS